MELLAVQLDENEHVRIGQKAWYRLHVQAYLLIVETETASTPRLDVIARGDFHASGEPPLDSVHFCHAPADCPCGASKYTLFCVECFELGWVSSFSL
jgi:hypothetical protein